MNIINPYVKVLKERYLSLIVIPMTILVVILGYAHIKGISFASEFEVITIIPIFAIIILLVMQVLKILVCLVSKNLIEAFAQATRFFVVVLTLILYDAIYLPDFTQKIENFVAEKKFYLRQVEEIGGNGRRDSKGKLVNFNSTAYEGTASCCVIYDESDTLLNPENDHRGLSISRDQNGKNIKLPIKIKKIETNFYYVCRDFSQLQPNYKKTSKENQ